MARYELIRTSPAEKIIGTYETQADAQTALGLLHQSFERDADWENEEDCRNGFNGWRNERYYNFELVMVDMGQDQWRQQLESLPFHEVEVR